MITRGKRKREKKEEQGEGRKEHGSMENGKQWGRKTRIIRKQECGTGRGKKKGN